MAKKVQHVNVIDAPSDFVNLLSTHSKEIGEGVIFMTDDGSVYFIEKLKI